MHKRLKSLLPSFFYRKLCVKILQQNAIIMCHLKIILRLNIQVTLSKILYIMFFRYIFRYNPRRAIVRQNQPPQSFYFILCGTGKGEACTIQVQNTLLLPFPVV